MSNILAKTTLALALSVASTVAYAQANNATTGTETMTEQPIVPDSGASGSGTSGAASTTTETQSGADASGTATQTESGTAATAEELPATGEAASGAAQGTTTEGAAETQTGTASGTEDKPTAADADAAAGTEQPADAQQTTETDQQPAETEQTTQGETEQNESGTATAEDAQQPSSETTSAVNITVEQQTQIKEVVREVNVEPVRDVDFEINVGVSVPRTIELRPLPPRIIEVVPAYRDYRFFILADGRIVIVEPATFEIVYILV